VQKLRKNRIAALLFQLIEIADRIFFFDGTPSRDQTCFIEHAFCQRSFA